jgi:hypothetical protein
MTRAEALILAEMASELAEMCLTEGTATTAAVELKLVAERAIRQLAKGSEPCDAFPPHTVITLTKLRTSWDWTARDLEGDGRDEAYGSAPTAEMALATAARVWPKRMAELT